jgi:hypothetical protein
MPLRGIFINVLTDYLKKIQVPAQKLRKMILYKEGTPKIPEDVMCFHISASYSSDAKFTKVVASNS